MFWKFVDSLYIWWAMWHNVWWMKNCNLQWKIVLITGSRKMNRFQRQALCFDMCDSSLYLSNVIWHRSWLKKTATTSKHAITAATFNKNSFDSRLAFSSYLLVSIFALTEFALIYFKQCKFIVRNRTSKNINTYIFLYTEKSIQNTLKESCFTLLCRLCWFFLKYLLLNVNFILCIHSTV